MTRRRLLVFGLLGTVAGIAIAACLLWPRTGITRDNAARISKGMTLAEVEAILGGPARNESDMPDNFINDAFITGAIDGRRPFAEKRWASPGFVVMVDFDESGQVIRHTDGDFNTASLFDKLRRWLGL